MAIILLFFGALTVRTLRDHKAHGRLATLASLAINALNQRDPAEIVSPPPVTGHASLSCEAPSVQPHLRQGARTSASAVKLARASLLRPSVQLEPSGAGLSRTSRTRTWEEGGLGYMVLTDE